MKKYDKSELVVVLDRINTCFHKHILSNEERRLLLEYVRTPLSKNVTVTTLLESKLDEYPDEIALLNVIDYFFTERGEKNARK